MSERADIEDVKYAWWNYVLVWFIVRSPSGVWGAADNRDLKVQNPHHGTLIIRKTSSENRKKTQTVTTELTATERVQGNMHSRTGS